MTLRHIDRPAAASAVGALVFFHGYSGDPAGFLALIDKLDPERRFHAYLPEAPHPGPSWFDRESAVPAAERLSAVVEWLDGLPFDRARTVLGGWSQGANVALSLGLGDRRRRPAAVLAIAGGFRNELPPDLARPLPPVALAHGQRDQSVPVAVARQTRELLEAAGATVLYRETDVGHEIDQAVIPDLRTFLAQLL